MGSLQPVQRSLLSTEIQIQGPFPPIPKQRTPVPVRYDAHVYVPHSRVRRKLVYPPKDDEEDSEDIGYSGYQCYYAGCQSKHHEVLPQQSTPAPWTLRALWTEGIQERWSDAANEFAPLRQAAANKNQVEQIVISTIPDVQDPEAQLAEGEPGQICDGVWKRTRIMIQLLKDYVAKGMKCIMDTMSAGLKYIVDLNVLESWLL